MASDEARDHAKCEPIHCSVAEGLVGDAFVAVVDECDRANGRGKYAPTAREAALEEALRTISEDSEDGITREYARAVLERSPK